MDESVSSGVEWKPVRFVATAAVLLSVVVVAAVTVIARHRLLVSLPLQERLTFSQYGMRADHRVPDARGNPYRLCQTWTQANRLPG